MIFFEMIRKSMSKRKNKTIVEKRRELLLKEDGQEYGHVTRLLGNRQLEIKCFDNITRICVIRGRFGRGGNMGGKINKIIVGDIVLVGLRDFQPGKGDVIYKYQYDETKLLKQKNEIPADVESVKSGDVNVDEIDDCTFNFDEI